MSSVTKIKVQIQATGGVIAEQYFDTLNQAATYFDNILTSWSARDGGIITVVNNFGVAGRVTKIAIQHIISVDLIGPA